MKTNIIPLLHWLSVFSPCFSSAFLVFSPLLLSRHTWLVLASSQCQSVYTLTNICQSGWYSRKCGHVTHTVVQPCAECCTTSLYQMLARRYRVSRVHSAVDEGGIKTRTDSLVSGSNFPSWIGFKCIWVEEEIPDWKILKKSASWELICKTRQVTDDQ